MAKTPEAPAERLHLMARAAVDYAKGSTEGAVERLDALLRRDNNVDLERWARWLGGELGADWCVCTRPGAPRAGLLTFEHMAGFACFERRDDDG
jgi:hypothetical protein